MSTHVLEHLIYLTPPGGLECISTEFRSLSFDVLPGGTHADGLTANTLITLPDGVYIELLAFVDPDVAPPPSHRYAAAPPGWTDFAFVGHLPDVDHVVNARAARDGSGVAYRPTALRGRMTPGPAGRQLQWRSAQPEAAHGIGRVPFFCGDVTPREWRVPAPGTHESTAQGVAYIKLRALGTEEFAALTAQLTTVLGIPPSTATAVSTTWPLDTPNGLPGLQTELILELGGDGASSPAKDNKSGIYEVGIWVDKGRDGQVETEHGSLVWKAVP